MKVPDHVMTIVDADGDEWHRCTKYTDDADPLVWRHDLGNLPPATLGWIQAVHGPITWDQENRPQWIPRTWADVRRGDTVRLPGTEHTATIADRYVSTGEDQLGRGRHVIAGPQHWDDHVVRPGECWLVFEGESTPRNMDAAKPVEILMSAAEVEASQRISDWWETRMEVINDA